MAAVAAAEVVTGATKLPYEDTVERCWLGGEVLRIFVPEAAGENTVGRCRIAVLVSERIDSIAVGSLQKR